MVARDLQQVAQIWPSIRHLVFVPRTDADYQRLVAMLDALIDVVGEDETHPLASLMDVVGTLIEKYEDEHVPEITDGE